MTDTISRTAALEVIDAVKGIVWSQSGKVLCGKIYSQIKDIPAVDEEQEPRVMTLEEVRCANEEPMWFESKGTFRGRKGFWVLSKGVSPSYVIRLIPAIGKDDTQLSLAAYGKVWRCWTSRPTDAQREATPWES